MPRQKRLPRGLGANGVVEWRADGEHIVREPAVLLEVVDEQRGRRGAIPKHQCTDSAVKRTRIRTARTNLPLQRARGVPLARSGGGQDGVAEAASDPIGHGVALGHAERAIRQSCPDQRHGRIQEKRATQ